MNRPNNILKQNVSVSLKMWILSSQIEANVSCKFVEKHVKQNKSVFLLLLGYTTAKYAYKILLAFINDAFYFKPHTIGNQMILFTKQQVMNVKLYKL